MTESRTQFDKSDYVFKRIFGAQNNLYDILADF